jgi:hypothetical protein
MKEIKSFIVTILFILIVIGSGYLVFKYNLNEIVFYIICTLSSFYSFILLWYLVHDIFFKDKIK